MSDFRYKAYLSYSHADQKTADWLHRSLEGFRVPGRLKASDGKPVPDSLAPIFKDREDLSSAADLSENLQQALAQSGALLVVCSPSAAGSAWVNEEIREFRKLRGGDAIFCIIVEGDPQAAVDDGGCFPPALFEGAEATDREPLAADARDFADGKRLALLKTAAGLLGVRLDDLRRRDLIRRRRRQGVLVAAGIAALALGGLTLNAKLAERQERAQAEQMAAFIVDLGEDLRGDIDLESLGSISATAMRYLEQLDPNSLTLESRIKVGKALRQVGDVNWLQGKPEAALDAFERSRSIFVNLNIEAPDNDEVLFQLSQAEFYSGYVYLDLGDYVKIREHWNRYLEIAQERHKALPDDPRWLLELSYATSNLVNIGLQLREDVDREVLNAIDNNIDLAGRALNANEGNSEVMVHYANELAFAADAQLSVCELQPALKSRIASLSVTQQLAAQAGAGFSEDLDVAYRNSGLANIYFALGDIEAARRHFQEALIVLERLASRDPSNEKVAVDLAGAWRSMSIVVAHQGDLTRAREQLDTARAILAPIANDEQLNPVVMDQYRFLVLNEVTIARLGEETQRALSWLDRNGPLLLAQDGAIGEPKSVRDARLLYRYERFMMTGIDPATENPALFGSLPADRGEYRSCTDAELLARHGVMTGDTELVTRQVSYLTEAGYRNPSYLEFCTHEGVCTP